MGKVGVDPTGIKLMKGKTLHYNLKVEGIDPRIANLLKQEKKREKIIQIAQTFNWNINARATAEFTLHFTDFLRNSTVFHETEWKTRQPKNGQWRSLLSTGRDSSLA
jgi:uncharacterized protein YktB (UPF0637 family)